LGEKGGKSTKGKTDEETEKNFAKTEKQKKKKDVTKKQNHLKTESKNNHG